MLNRALKIWEPFRNLARLEDDFDALMDSLFDRFKLTFDGNWYPAVDVVENDGNLEIKAEIPGIKKEDLKISITDNILTISGEKKKESETKDKHYHRIERYYGSFCRTIPLPEGVDRDKVKASYKDGVLTVTLPKPESMKTKEIEVEIK
uniref:Hsp20/alpha crystallin family protein n=1 Tax=candidate division WOR-3 bacterium TaxID=2052148 RepID=A0A7C4XL07_UNCW3